MSVELALAIAGAGVLVGILSALFGVGGGILMVPFMVLALDKGQHLSEGTSLLVIVPTAAVGVLMHNKGNFVSFRTGALLAAGGMGGAYLGAALALRLPAETLRMMFGILMAFVGIRTVRRGLTQMRSEAAILDDSAAPIGDD